MLRRVTLLVGLMLVALTLGGLYWLVFTEWGLRVIAAELERLERFGIRLEGVSGTLAGPIRIERFELEHPRLHIVVTDLVAEPRLPALALQIVALDSLSAASALVELRGGEAVSKRVGPPQFLPPWLRIRADRADLRVVRFVTAGGNVELDADRVRARVRLTPQQLRVDEILIETPQYVTGGRVRLRSEETLRLEVVANGRVLIEGRPDLELSGELRGTPERLELVASLQAPGTATATATLAKSELGSGGWRIDGRLESADPGLDAWLTDAPFSVRDVDAEFQFADGQAAVQGSVLIPELDPLPVSLAAQAQYAERTLVVSSAEFRLEDAPAILAVHGRVQFAGAAPGLDLGVQWTDLSWPLRETPAIASASGRLGLSGSLPYRFTLSAGVEIPGQPAAELSASGAIDRLELELDDAAVRIRDSTVTGHGRLVFGARPRWQFDLEGRRVDPSLWVAALPGEIDFDLGLAGEGLDRTSTGVATLESLGGRFRGLPVGGSGRVERTLEGWRIEALAARLGGSRARLDADLSERLEASWSVSIDELASLLPEARGQLRCAGTASGTLDAPQVSATLTAASLGYAGWSVAAVAAEADIDLADREPSRLELELTDLGTEKPTLHSVQLTVAGLARAHDIRMTAVSTATGPEARPARAELSASGSYVEGLWSGRLEAVDVVEPLGGGSLKLSAPVAFSAARDQAGIDAMCLDFTDGRFCGHGAWRADGPWSLEAQADNIPLSFLGDVLPGAPRYSGRWEARLNAEGLGASVTRGDALLRVTNGRVTYRLVGGERESVHLGSGQLRVEVTPQRIDGDVRLEASERTFVQAELGIKRDPGRAFLEQEMTGTLQARSTDTGVLPLVVPELDAVSGRLEADLALFGTLRAPQVDGVFAVREGSVDLYRLNLILRDAELVARVRDNSLSLNGGGRVGEGRLSVEGAMSWTEGRPLGRLGLKGENLLVADVPELRLVASPDLKFRIDGRRLDAEGEVLIPSARIEPRDLRTAARTSADARIVGEAPAAEGSSLDVRSRIQVRMGDDVRIDAVGLTGKLAGSVTAITGVSDVDTGRGEIHVSSGKYEAYGQKLDIIRGRLLFDGTPLADPGLDVQAEKEVAEVTVGLNVRGTLREPRLSFYSDPSMPQSQILSYLLIGEPIDQAGTQQAATVGAARENLTLQGGGLLASQLGRRLGFEEVGIEANGQEDTALVLGKFLSPRLFVSYGISLTESINTLKVRYTISDRWTLKTEAGEHQSADVEFKIER